MKIIIFYATMLLSTIAIISCGGGEHNPVKDKNESKIDAAKNETAVSPKSLRIHIDNSGSMRGYTEWNQTTFVTSISDLYGLGNENLNANIFLWGNNKPITGNYATTLKNSKFDGADTPFPSIFKSMVKNIDTNNSLEVIVTDGIISFDSKNQENIDASLGQVKNEIRDALKQSSDIAVCVYRLTSGYSNNKGGKDRYYTKQYGINYILKEVQRPFFVIAIGKRANIQWLINEVSAKKETMSSIGNAEYLAFGIHNHDTSLKLKNDKYFNGSKLKYSRGSFSVKPDLPECLFTNMTANELQQGLEVLVNGEEDDNFSVAVKGHRLEFKCKEIGRIKKEKNTVTIKLKNSLSQKWIDDYSSDDDLNIQNDKDQQNRTFALSTLLRGIYEATDVNKMLIDATFTFSK